MHPYSRASIASALNSRTLSLHGALGRSKSSRENLLIHAHAALLRWLISCVSSPSSLTRPPKYRNWVVWAYFCPAASMTSRGGGDPPFFGANELIVLHPLGIFILFFLFLVRKIPFAGIELTSQRVRRLRGAN